MVLPARQSICTAAAISVGPVGYYPTGITPKKKPQNSFLWGGLSSLKKKVEPDKGVPHDFDHPAEDVTVAYCRDRGEPLSIMEYKDITQSTDEELIKRLADYTGSNYVYLFKENQWMVGAEFNFLPTEMKNYPGIKPLVFYPLVR